MPTSFDRKSITLEAARSMLTAAAQKAQEIGVPMAIAVADSEGTLKAFVRMHGAPLLALRIAQQKAWVAISFGMATHQWFEFIKDDPPLLHGIVRKYGQYGQGGHRGTAAGA